MLSAFLLTFTRKKIKGLVVPNIKKWMSNFRKRMLILQLPLSGAIETLKAFVNTDIFIVKNLNFKTNKNLIAICVIRNDLEKLKKFLEHHRNLGIKQFAFLDDNSTDGTKEYLQEQQDVELFGSSDSYATSRKDAWVNRIMAYYGIDRWYAVLDSDELLVYDNCEKFKIDKFIALMKNENIKSVSGKMIDIYFYNEMEYFDKTGYFDYYKSVYLYSSGGMRHRIFGIQTPLRKTPLFFFDDKSISFAHYLFPFEKKSHKKNSIALLHYKFLESDLEKYKERIKNNCMHNGSHEYKKYVEKIENGKLNYYDESISEKYENSKNLVKNSLMETLDFQ